VKSGVCAFIGPAGAGKSTIAASLLAEGHELVADDCLPLKRSRGQVFAVPAYPGLRLWRDACEALGIADRVGVKVSHYSAKSRMLTFGARFVRAPQPLVRIYALDRGDLASSAAEAPFIEPLIGRDAFFQLVRASYTFDATDRRALKRDFAFLASLASDVGVRRLRVPNDFALLPAVREAVLADLDN